MTPENNTSQEQYSPEQSNLENYLSIELKLQEKIDTKLQDPNLKELAKKELQDIKTRFDTSLLRVKEYTFYFCNQKVAKVLGVFELAS